MDQEREREMQQVGRTIMQGLQCSALLGATVHSTTVIYVIQYCEGLTQSKERAGAAVYNAITGCSVQFCQGLAQH